MSGARIEQGKLLLDLLMMKIKSKSLEFEMNYLMF
jgi:hypothetical protein